MQQKWQFWHTISCGLDDVFPPDAIGYGLYTQFIIICITSIIAEFWLIEMSFS